MPHRRSPSSNSRAKPQRESPPAVDWIGTVPVLPLLVLLLAIVLELLLYFGDVPQQTRDQRLSVLVFLLAPDHLLELWCGGKLAYFSLLDRWPIMLLTAAILGTAWLAGRLLLYGLGVLRLLDRLEQHVFAIGTGLNLVSLYALAIGLAGGLHLRWLFVAPIAALVIADLCIFFLAGTKPGPNAAATDEPFAGANNPRWYWWLLAVLPFALVIILG